MAAGERLRAIPVWLRVVLPAVVVALIVGALVVTGVIGGRGTTSVHAQAGPPASTTSTTTTTTTTSPTTTTTAPPPDTAPLPPTTAPLPTVPAPADPEPAPPAGPRLVTYDIATDGAVVSSVDELAAIAEQTYADPRGWSAAGIQFRHVDGGGDFTIVLANPDEVPNYAPGTCDSTYSCQAGHDVVLNDARWSQGSPNWPGPLGAYRQMVLNHETGHWLGLGHATCPGPGQPAPVMQQQSIDMQGCAINSWPLEWELDRVR
jgi:hypothetical protein